MALSTETSVAFGARGCFVGMPCFAVTDYSATALVAGKVEHRPFGHGSGFAVVLGPCDYCGKTRPE